MRQKPRPFLEHEFDPVLVHVLGETYGRLPTEILSLSPIEVATNISILMKGRKWEQEKVKDPNNLEGKRDAFIEEGLAMLDQWIESLPVGSKLRLQLEMKREQSG